MGRRLVLGTKPEVDPLEDLKESRSTITTGTEIRWEDRSVGLPVSRLLFGALVAIIICLYIPELAIVASVIILLAQLFSPKLHGIKELADLLQDSWEEVPEGDLSLSVESKTLGLRGTGSPRHVIGLELGKASPNLLGNVGSLVRALDTSNGFGLYVVMKPGSITQAMDQEKISNFLEGYLIALSKGELDAYLVRRSGLWVSQVTILGHIHHETEVNTFEAAIRGSIPEKEWKQIKPRILKTRIGKQEIDRQDSWFFAAGSELCDWLVQLRSELAPEVGSNIPGQFIAPIRPRPDDFRLGLTLNPDTLQTGPPAGLSIKDLETGTLVCGGNEESRQRTLSLLISELLKAGKRVLLITKHPESAVLTNLSESSVYLELGKDLVLNPVDSDGIPRNEYVPLLISSLEVVAGIDLRGSAELEVAVSRAVSLGNSTLADVRLNPDFDDPTVTNDNRESPAPVVSKKTATGMEAIRSLHMGPAARAFYGTQTVPIRRITDPSLTVVSVSLGSIGLDSFAWNLLCLKLGGLTPNSNLVIMLDEAENMRVRNRRYMKHDSLSEKLLAGLRKRGPIVLTLEHPADMAPGAIGVLASCVSLRLRESVDIHYAADLLGLNVITTGMHSKARISPRESSFLRIMDDSTALLVHDGTETAQPIKLDETPEFSGTNSSEDMAQRIDRLVPIGTQEISLHGRTLLDMVASGETDLAVRVLKLLERYEPLTEEAVRRFVVSSGEEKNPDIEGILARLEHASMILRGHENHSGVSYSNFRITMKGSMALRQAEEVGGASA